ncbi:MAG: tetratricopeptide repeat protein, partial [bacterium]
MKLHHFMIAVVAFAFILLSVGYAQQSAEQLFQSGLYKEEVEGELDTAIKIYETIINEYPENRPVASKALLHIGLCYEKLGRSEAQKAYNRVLQEYADQPEAVAQARARLTALGQAAAVEAQPTGPVIRELKIERDQPGLSLSRDGRKLAYCKGRNIVIRDLVSGEETKITNYVTGGTMDPVFSPDGKEIAYARWPNPLTWSLHIVSLQTGEDRSLDPYGHPLDWSRDGRFLLVALKKDGWTFDILSITEGVIQKLNLSVTGEEQDFRFSPDGRYVSYSHNGNLYLYPMDGEEAVQIIPDSIHSSQPIWSPDGKMLLFLSNRAFGPELDLCGVPIVDGKVAGDVRIIRPDFGGADLISLSETGRLLYERSPTGNYIYSVAIDPQTGQPAGEPTRLAVGLQPIWSPDGKRIAYFVGEFLREFLHVMSADGSDDQKIIKVCRYKGTYAWAPDNDHIYIQEDRETGPGIYAISISTKERHPILIDSKIMGHLTCSPDGKQLAFIRYPESFKRLQVFLADIDGSNLRQLTFGETGGGLYP